MRAAATLNQPDKDLAESIKLSLVWNLVERGLVPSDRLPGLLAAEPDDVLDFAFQHCGMIRARHPNGTVIEIYPGNRTIQ